MNEFIADNQHYYQDSVGFVPDVMPNYATIEGSLPWESAVASNAEYYHKLFSSGVTKFEDPSSTSPEFVDLFQKVRNTIKFFQDSAHKVNAWEKILDEGVFVHSLNNDLSFLEGRIETEWISFEKLYGDLSPEQLGQYYALLETQYEIAYQQFLRLKRSLKGLAKRICLLGYQIDYRTNFRQKINVIFKNLDDDHIA